jgi:hypothetical protein
VAIDRAGRHVSGDPLSATTQPGLVGTIGSAPTASGTSSGRPSPSAEPSDAATSPASPVTTSSPSARTQTRTWSGTPGFVTASCTGNQVRITGFSPNEGWHTERGDDSGDDDAEVKFEKNEAEVQVRATCVGGAPRFQVESGEED